MSHRRDAIVLGAFVLSLFAASPALAASSPTVTASPALSPAFSTKITDYTTTCATGTVSVTSNVPSGASLRIDGKTAAKGRTTRKLKLRAGQRFQMISGSGKTALTHSVRCLPADFPKWTVTGTLPADSPMMAFSVSAPSSFEFPYAIISDARGVPIWWLHTPKKSSMDVKITPGGNIGFFGALLAGDTGNGPFSIYSPAGVKVRDVKTVGGSGDAHETLPTSRGTFYRTAGVRRDHIDLTSIGGSADGSVWDDVIQEIATDGSVIWSWSMFDHVSLSETTNWAWLLIYVTQPGSPLDLLHMNSIEEDGQGGLVISARHLDAVYRIRKSDGAISWKLGGTNTAQSLAVTGDSANDAARFSGQHDARVQPDGSVTLYDNGSGVPGRAPRVVRWQINAEAGTAALVEEFRDPLIAGALAGGSARKLTNGGWLVAWCDRPYIRAYSAAHNMVFSMKFAVGGRSYRAVPVKTSDISRGQLVSGMDKQFPR
ncbi:MAG: aryl-sulfate sulfotransferase [Solirubrobacterales bacterium]|nr:aryl-sulfate sulfotransferase [Solirubrobacterales bacterium]